ncbi:hypothetical protein, partial [Enterococcus hirae]|uniref:hypothetical protein n=1 Tax=Enterococcus hirae TaxID=1354 RepID=UPI0032E48070
DLFDDSSNDSLTTDEIVEALMEIDETLDSAKNLVDYVNGSNELQNNLIMIYSKIHQMIISRQRKKWKR